MPRLLAAAAVALLLTAASPMAAAMADEQPVADAVASVDVTVPADHEAVTSETAAAESASSDPVAEPAAIEQPPAAPTAQDDAAPAAQDAAAASDDGLSTAETASDAPELGALHAGVNTAPVAVDDHYEMTQDTLLVVGAAGLIDNDFDPDGDWFQYYNGLPASSGEVRNQSTDGSFEFQPAQGFTGTVSFEYWVRDAHQALSNHATVTIEVKPTGEEVYLPPTAVADEYLYATSIPLYIEAGVLTNDALHGDAPTVSLALMPTGAGAGSVQIDGDGSFLFTPAPGTSGLRWFRYRVCTTGGCSLAEVTLKPTAAGEAPSGPSAPGADTAPIAADDFYTVANDVLFVSGLPGVLGNDDDPNPADSINVIAVGAPQHGVVAEWNEYGWFRYMADPGFVGTDTFSYTISDGFESDTAIVTIEVTGCTGCGAPTDGGAPTGGGTSIGGGDPTDPGTPETASTPLHADGLAMTGTDGRGIVWAAITLLLAGIALAALRRRASADAAD